jgi:hypothetical protein
LHITEKHKERDRTGGENKRGSAVIELCSWFRDERGFELLPSQAHTKREKREAKHTKTSKKPLGLLL